jgi:hypothetical protein
MMMNIREIINAYVDENKKIELFLTQLPQNNKEADEMLPEFTEFLARNQGNTQLALFFSMYLQLADQQEIIEQFEFEDIRKLYQGLIALDALPVDVYEESANFEWKVMDQKEQALKIIESGIHEAQQRMEVLNTLAREIRNSK